MTNRREAIRMMVAAVLVAATGCKRREQANAAPVAEAPAEEVQAVLAILARGMQAVPRTSLKAEQVSRSCVVVARTPQRAGPPDAPPPLGMVRILGGTTIYKGQIHAVSREAVEVHAPYPNSGRLKIVSIPATDIQSIHVGK